MASSKATLFPLFFSFFMPVTFFMPQPNGALINLSQFADDIAISTQVPRISSINLRLQKYLKQI